MRTTVAIDDELLRRAREVALRGGRTLGDVVNDALRVALAEPDVPLSPAPALPVYGGSGLQPGVDLADKDALTALLEAPGGGRAAG